MIGKAGAELPVHETALLFLLEPDPTETRLKEGLATRTLSECPSFTNVTLFCKDHIISYLTLACSSI